MFVKNYGVYMNKLRNRAIKVFLALALAIAFAAISTGNTYAAYDTNDILKRAMVRNLMNCYDKGYITKSFNSIGELKGAESLNNNGDNSEELPIPSGSSFTNIAKESLKCSAVIKGVSGLSGVFGGSISGTYELTGHPVPSGTDSSASSFLTKYAGYTAKTNEQLKDGECVFGKFKKTTYASQIDYIQKKGTSTIVITNPICAEKLKNGKIDGNVVITNSGGKGGYDLGFSGYGNVMFVDTTKKAVRIAYKNDNTNYGTMPIPVYEDIPYANENWSTFKNNINNAFGKPHNQVFNTTVWQNEYNSSWIKSETVYAGQETCKPAECGLSGSGTGPSLSSFTLATNAGVKTGAALLGVSEKELNNKINISAQEQVHLYMYYLTTLYSGNVDCSEIDQTAASANGYDGPIKWFKTGETTVTENCYVTAHRDRDVAATKNMVNGLSSNSGGYFKLRNVGYDQLIAYFKNLSITELDDAAGSATANTGDDTDEAERAPDCHTNAGALGWFLCPVIEASSNAVEKIYTGLIESYLSIDAVLFDTNSTGGAAVHGVWGIFQGFANLAFTIVFLIVIFSQLTGIGVDNYGIKKILPKLLVGAILINLSYVICQLSVDTSNIMGRAVKGLFQNMAGTLDDSLAKVSVNLNPSMAPTVPGKFPSGTLVIVGIAGILGVGAFLAAGFAIIIPALVALVSLVIGILFLFIMLALRQAVAVILVVISPLAFAAYILPNTKKLIFNKWFEAFKGMLIAYPICSALVYGGDFVSKILIVAETGNATRDLSSLGMTLSAAAVAIAPIFFIPSVIRKGMNGIAGLGDALNRMQNTATGAYRRPVNERLQSSRLADYQNRRRGYRDAVTRRRRQDGDAINKDRIAEQARRELDGTRARDRIAGVLTGGALGRGLQERVNRDGIASLSPRERAHYQQTVGTMTAHDKELTALYEDSFSTMDRAAVETQLNTMVNSGHYDPNLAIAAINRIGQFDQGGYIINAVRSISNMDGFGQNTRDANRLVSCLKGQDGNLLLKGYGTALGRDNRLTFDNFRSDTTPGGNNMTRVIQDMGVNAFDGIDRDNLEYISQNQDIVNMFSAEQSGHLYGSGLSGRDGQQVVNYMNARRDLGAAGVADNNGNTNRVTQDVQSMPMTSAANVTAELARELRQTIETEGQRIGRTVPQTIQAALAPQIAEMQQSQNAQILAHMQRGTREVYGIPNPRQQQQPTP